MAINCDPCVCPEQWYRDSQSWRKATIILLCGIEAAIGGGGGGGSATAANQVLEIAQLTAINSNTTGVSTAALQTAGNASLTTIATNTGTTATNTGTIATNTGTTATNTGIGAATLLKAEDAAHVSGDAGVEMLARRADTASSSSGTDGDYSTLNTDSTGHLWTTGTQIEDVPHVSGDAGVFLLGVRTDARPTYTSTNGDYSPIACNDAGALRIVYDQGYQNNSTTSLMKLEDQASANGDGGVNVFAVRADTPSTTTSTDGDYTQLFTNSLGAQYSDSAFKVQAAVSGTLGFASVVTGSYATLISNSAKARAIKMNNKLDVMVIVSFDASTTQFYVDAGEIWNFDFAANGTWMATSVSVKAVGSNASVGNIYASILI